MNKSGLIAKTRKNELPVAGDQGFCTLLSKPSHFTSETPQAIFPKIPSLGRAIVLPFPKAEIIPNNIFVHHVFLSNIFGGRACSFCIVTISLILSFSMLKLASSNRVALAPESKAGIRWFAATIESLIARFKPCHPPGETVSYKHLTLPTKA